MKPFLLQVDYVGHLSQCPRGSDTETGHQRSGVVATTKRDHVVLRPLELACRKNLEKFGNANLRESHNAISRA